MPPIPRDAPPLRFHIRAAKPSDVEGILGLITALAIYEKEPESVKTTPELLTTNLFGPTPYAHCLLAFSGAPASTCADTTSSIAPDHEPAPIGIALYFFNFSTHTGKPGLYLEDLFVEEEARGIGIGKAFFAELGRIALEKACARMDWCVLKWNTPSIGFYEKALGAKGMDEFKRMRLEEDGIRALSQITSPRIEL